ncbi:MAG: DNA repair protein RecN [Syntrophomonadaceae bacterium]|nr:DNA repair protein RecN [Syntrophomonadaceae bacterium]
MLRELYIKNIVLIDELRLQFGAGLNVLTGETGAGKSIVVDCLELLVGERFNSEVIRNREHKGIIEGVFEVTPDSPLAQFLQERDLWEDDDEILIIRREITPQGRSINRVNGHTVTAAMLRSLAEYLVDIHMQNDSQQVLNPRFHRQFLDSLSPEIKEILPRLEKTYHEWQSTVSRIEELKALREQKTRDLDFIEYQIAEIESAALVEGEDEELLAERSRLLNWEKAVGALSRADNLLFEDGNGALVRLAQARQALNGIDDGFFKELAAAIEEAYYLLEDIRPRIARFRDEEEYDPARLEAIEERLQVLNKIKRKYGGSIAAALDFLTELKNQRSSLEDLEFRTQELEERKRECWQEYQELATRVSEFRHQAARVLEARIEEELAQLSMPGVTFKIDINPADPAASGIDEVVFQFSANPGEAPRPINKIASGGESSRFILALKTALADVYRVPVLVFDEIDAGVGGQALLQVGAKLKELSRHHQVILVTHSPQIACLADSHQQLEKVFESGETRVTARVLDFEGRVVELSRMLAGDNANAIAWEHARQMLMNASDNR